jgi:alkanesulfonate monooxygenase SsuD/methylene tetrahydromethanopterin reductase-like flavin-dependent oxidoreductase (luciferase family)
LYYCIQTGIVDDAAQPDGGTMKFGYFENLHDVTQQRSYLEMIDELREIAQLCDSGGFDTFWLPEHHFSIWGRELLPNPLMMLADLAPRTKNIRLGLAAAIITHWHPMRLAEDLALLDNLTGGRLEIGVGRGNYGLEATNLNAQADPNNQEQNFKVFVETLEIVKKALSQERFSHRGEFYAFPAPGFRADRAHSVNDPAYIDKESGELIKLTTYPRPHQKPYPPLWQMVDSDRSIEHAAAQDCGIIMWRPTIASLKQRLRLYRDTAQRTRGIDLPVGARTAIMRDTFVAESEAEARRIAESSMMASLNFSNWRGPKIFLNPGEELTPEQEAQYKKKLTYDFVGARSVFFGAPDHVLDKLEELDSETGVEQVVLKCSWPGMPHEHTMRSLRLLTTEVLPRFRARRVGRKAAAAAE